MNTPLLLFPLGIMATALSAVGVRLIHRYAVEQQRIGRHQLSATSTRGGGLAILVVVLLIFMPVGFSLGDPGQIVRFALAGAMIGAIGFFDDLRALPRFIRVFAQALAALIFVPAAPIDVIGLPGLKLWLPQTLSYILSVLWIVVMSNVYTHMDGLNGLASGQTVVAGGLWVVVGLLADQPVVVLLGLLVAGAALGFTIYNLPPNSIFLGDVGSMFLGFSLAALPMLSAAQGASSRLIVSGGLFVGLFVFDAVLTFLRYLITGRDVTETHRSHLYQRLVELGEPPNRVTFLYLALSVGFGLSGLLYWRSETLLALLICTVVCLALFTWITCREIARRALP